MRQANSAGSLRFWRCHEQPGGQGRSRQHDSIAGLWSMATGRGFPAADLHRIAQPQPRLDRSQ